MDSESILSFPNSFSTVIGNSLHIKVSDIKPFIILVCMCFIRK